MRELAVATLCYPHQGSRILLGKKKRGVGQGFWNGFGGSVKRGESIEEAAIRELYEECRLRGEVKDLKKVALLRFHWSSGPMLYCHVYFLEKWQGEEQSTDEMEPWWFSKTELPFNEMWPDDRLWLPRVLSGETLEGDVYFESDNLTMRESNFKEISF